MKLVSARVRKFRNVIDSGEISFEEDVTCLVGKNESGKTSILQALHRLNPAPSASAFDELEDYPRQDLSDDRSAGLIKTAKPIECVFELEKEDVAAVENALGAGVLKSNQYTLARKYSQGWTAGFKVDEVAAVTNYLDYAEVYEELRRLLKPEAQAEDFADGTAVIDGLEDEKRADAEQLSAQVAEKFKQGSAWSIANTILRARVPQFFYFSQYQTLPGRINISELAEEDQAPAQSSLQTARALLRLAGADTQIMTAEQFDRRKAELEAVSNKLTREVFRYWTQSDNLLVDIDADFETVNTPQGQTAVVKYLDVRVRDTRHGYTGNFSQRSSGFQWFFSFLAAFSEFENQGHGVIVLLDEPALNLHGRAQADFLRFINERLAAKSQVVYTTHSPFMVEPSRLERVRIVEDKGIDIGSVVSKDVHSVGSDSLFPLQAALGYDIAQNLFIGPDNLLLEGTSDYTYLRIMSDHLASLGREGLSERWRMMQSAGATNMPTFVALLGDKLDVTLLIDGTSKNLQKIQNLVDRRALPASRLLIIDAFTGLGNSDVEDMFTPAEFLKLYNKAFGTSLTVSGLTGKDRIIDRISRAEGVPFTKHGKPADALLRDPDRAKFLKGLSTKTLQRFEDLFEAINKTLSP